jgi:hypothetical protein
VKQERHSNKIGKTYSSGVALLEDQDQDATTKNANAQCKHCGRNDHQRKSSAICPFFQGKADYISTGTTDMVADTVPANTPKKYMCIQCGWCKFAMPCKSGQSNGGN